MKKIVSAILVLLAFVSGVAAQADCPDVVEEALTRAAECTGLERNQVCYGNNMLTATPREEGIDVLEEVGDTADLVEVQGLELSELDENEGVWGIAVLSVQANLPDTLPGQNVTMLMFGDTVITDAATPEEAQAEDFVPMQAFYFSSGIGESACAEAPESGILIQTPEGAGEIELTMNDVSITLGSTAYIQAQAEGEMVFNVIEGGGVVEADGAEVEVPAGTFVTVPLDEDLQAAGEPSEPQPYNADDFSALPLELLPREIEVAGAGEDTAGGTSLSDPLGIEPGTWQTTITSIEGCGADSSMVSSMPAQSYEITSDSIEALLRVSSQNGETLTVDGLDFEISRPEANVLIFDFEVEGSAVHIVYTVISTTEIEVEMEITYADCVMTITSTMEHIGD